MNNKSIKLGLIGIIVVLLCVLIFNFVYYFFITPQIVNQIEYNSTIEVATGLNLGVDADGDHLGFGKGIPGSQQIKNFTVGHTYDDELLVKILFEGEFADWITMSEDTFNLSKDEHKNITIKAKIPDNATPGNYTGKLITLFIKE